MTDAPALPFRRSEDDRVLAGVCGGVASALAVDATLVRLAFALLALAGGAGILLYLALWTYASRTPWIGQLLIAVSAIAFLLALGLSGVAVVGAGLLVAGVAVVLAPRRLAASGRIAADSRDRAARWPAPSCCSATSARPAR